MTSVGSSPELALESFTVSSDPCSFGLTISYLRSVTFDLSDRRSCDSYSIVNRRIMDNTKQNFKSHANPALKDEVFFNLDKNRQEKRRFLQANDLCNGLTYDPQSRRVRVQSLRAFSIFYLR